MTEVSPITKSLILGRHGWPYGATRPVQDRVTRRALIDWATRHDLRRATSVPSLCWVRYRRCTQPICECKQTGHYWLDHVTGWVHNKCETRILLAQPYAQEEGNLMDLLATCRELGLRFHVNGDGWYGNGTFAIWIEDRD